MTTEHKPHSELVERAARGLRAAAEFINKLPLTDGASERAKHREHVSITLIPDGLLALDRLWEAHDQLCGCDKPADEGRCSAPEETWGAFEYLGERERVSSPADEPDPTEGLPPELVRVLRDPTITIARDHEIRLADGRTLFEHIEEWRNAPSDTASASIPASTLTKSGDAGENFVKGPSDPASPAPSPATSPKERVKAATDRLRELGESYPDVPDPASSPPSIDSQLTEEDFAIIAEDADPAISPRIVSYEADGDGRMYAKYDNGEILPTGKVSRAFAGKSDITPERYTELFPAKRPT